MLQFLATYGSSIIVALIVAFIVFLVIRSMVIEKKSGKGGCGGSCASCGGCCASCHPTQETSKHKKLNN